MNSIQIIKSIISWQHYISLSRVNCPANIMT